MRYLLLTVGFCLTLTGCYTMIYPPLEEVMTSYSPSGSTLTITDSVSGNNVTIINQNQIFFDRYYQDPYYLRGDVWGGARCWDPYYYNPYRYRPYRHWHHGRYHPGNAPGAATPKPKTPRREKDHRQSEAPPDDSTQLTEVVNIPLLTPSASLFRAEPLKHAPSEPAKAVNYPPAKPANDNRDVRTVTASKPPEPEKQPDTVKTQEADKTPRRGNSRER